MHGYQIYVYHRQNTIHTQDEDEQLRLKWMWGCLRGGHVCLIPFSFHHELTQLQALALTHISARANPDTIHAPSITHQHYKMANFPYGQNILHRVPTKIGKQDSMTDLLFSMTPILTWSQIWLYMIVSHNMHNNHQLESCHSHEKKQFHDFFGKFHIPRLFYDFPWQLFPGFSMTVGTLLQLRIWFGVSIKNEKQLKSWLGSV